MQEKITLESVDPSTVEASPELDALIHESIFGEACEYVSGAWRLVPPRGYEIVPSYSTEIGAAMKAFESLGWGTLTLHKDDGGKWRCQISTLRNHVRGIAGTLPLSICRTALAMVKNYPGKVTALR